MRIDVRAVWGDAYKRDISLLDVLHGELGRVDPTVVLEEVVLVMEAENIDTGHQDVLKDAHIEFGLQIGLENVQHSNPIGTKAAPYVDLHFVLGGGWG